MLALVIAADTGPWLMPVQYERKARAAGNAQINTSIMIYLFQIINQNLHLKQHSIQAKSTTLFITQIPKHNSSLNHNFQIPNYSLNLIWI